MSNIGGRPTVITQATVQKLEDAFKAGFSVSEACMVSGISRATYYDHKANTDGFSDKMDRARAWVTLQAKHVMVKAIVADADVPSSKWWLERKARNEFGTNAVDEEAQWEAQHTTDADDDTLRQILDSMKASGNAAINNVAQTTKHEAPSPSPVSPQPALTHATQTPLDPSDILADLYGED